MKNMRFKIIGLLAAVLLAPAAQAADKRPNILFILTDDHRWDAMGFMGAYPFLKTPNLDRLRNEGAHMKNAFVTLSMCAPSRASFLTGLYPHAHGVSNNNEERECDWQKTPSFAQYLQKAGYHTGFIGKFHMAPTNDPRPGFDYWVSFTGQGNYNGNTLGVNGKVVHEPGYVTDVLTRYAKDFIKQDHAGKPFMLYLSHKAVHQPFTPAKRHKDLYPDARFEPPATLQEDRSNKPLWQRSIEWKKTVFVNGKLTYATPNTSVMEWDEKNGFIGRSKPYLQTLAAVDDSIGDILQLLETRGELDNTFIVYAGDNGYLLGEHGRSDKRVAYNECMRIPMLIRYPEKIKPGATIEEHVLNVDLAPTLLDLASAKDPGTFHGSSMLPLFAGKTEGWRKGFVYNYNWDLHPLIPTIVAYRTPGFLLSTTPNRDDLDELYDERRDPLETNNLINDPEYAAQKKRLENELEKAKAAIGFTLTVPDPKVGRWYAPENVSHRFVPPNKKMSPKTKIKLPAEKSLNLSLGTVSWEFEFSPESDGMVFNQYAIKKFRPDYSEINGFMLYVENGRVNLCYQRRQVSYILRDDQDVLGHDPKVKVGFSSDGKWITLQVNDGAVLKSLFTDPIIPVTNEAVLGRAGKRLPDTVPAKDGFTGAFRKMTLRQTVK